MNKKHNYSTALIWTGNRGKGTVNYRAYDRSYTISIGGKPDISGSSDPAFLGDRRKYNPEELLLASLSSCHMLSYLHLCANAGIIVTDYRDEATGIMQESDDGGGHFMEVILHPEVTITDGSFTDHANRLHSTANKNCFIANSCNFPVRHKPVCIVTQTN